METIASLVLFILAVGALAYWLKKKNKGPFD